jgi:hypothetical protein
MAIDTERTSLPYEQFQTRHDSYDADYWQRLRAFYAGGKKLFSNERLMAEIFPKHRDELEQIYEERKKRAHYVPYAGEIIDHIVAALCAQPS